MLRVDGVEITECDVIHYNHDAPIRNYRRYTA
jgi:hypothetical protein